MLHSLLDLLKSLTDPPRLIELLSTVMTGWLGYAALFAIVFAETGLLIGFFGRSFSLGSLFFVLLDKSFERGLRIGFCGRSFVLGESEPGLCSYGLDPRSLA